MLKADQPTSTIASGLNRRGILSGGSVVNFPRLNAPNSPFSPEFHAWYDLAKSLPQVLAEDDAWIASQFGRGVLDPKASPHARLCNEMRPLETYLCMRSTTEPASVIAAIELAMIALWWTEGGGGGTLDDPFAVDPFALSYDPNLDEETVLSARPPTSSRSWPASSSREAPMTKQPMSRRQLLRQSAAAAVVIPSAAYAVGSSPTASPELQEWRDARKLYWEAVGVSHETSRRFAAAYVEHHPLRGTVEPETMRPTDELRAIDLYLEGPHDPLILVDEKRFIDALIADPSLIAANERWTICEDRLDAAIAALLARPVRSWDDVAEMAELAWGDARWFFGDRHPDDEHFQTATSPLSMRLSAR